LNFKAILLLVIVIISLAACGTSEDVQIYTVSAEASEGGSVSPSIAFVTENNKGSFTVKADSGFQIKSVVGCGGLLVGDQYQTAQVGADCAVSAEFELVDYTVTTKSLNGGGIEPLAATVKAGSVSAFTILPEADYKIKTVSGCGGNLEGYQYQTTEMVSNCEITVEFETRTYVTPEISLVPAKSIQFTWRDMSNATHYRILENKDGQSGYSQFGDDIAPGMQTAIRSIPLYFRLNATYMLQTCFGGTCVDSQTYDIAPEINNAIGYLKSSNPNQEDSFGASPKFSRDIIFETIGEGGSELSLSEDGRTLVVGAQLEDGSATGINGDDLSNDLEDSGAAYVFIKQDSQWSQQAYIKPSITQVKQKFGNATAISADGNTIAISAISENEEMGAVYIFARSGVTWSQQARINASNAELGDAFGASLAFSDDGNTLAIGAKGEDSSSKVVNGDQTSNAAPGSGAVYVFKRNGSDWAQHSFLKASNSKYSAAFGYSVSLSGNGTKLAIGAIGEMSAATGINGDQNTGVEIGAGAVYLFNFDGDDWQQEAYIKASNTDASDSFGSRVSLNQAGNILAVSAPDESSDATGINGDQANNRLSYSGAVYMFEHNATVWSQHAYIKAGHNGFGESGGSFGADIELSDDGNILAVSFTGEDSDNVGFPVDSPNSANPGSGAVAIFERSVGNWQQKVVVKSSNPDDLDRFGGSLSLSGDSETLAVSAGGEDSALISNQVDNSSPDSGAVYIY